MTTNQTMLTIGAVLLFSTMLIAFYRLLANSSETLNNAQAGISELTFATTYMELAQGLAFDENTDSTYLDPSQISQLTAPDELGPDTTDENQFGHFNDIDDLNNYEIVDTSQQGISGVYKTHFNVYYVNPTNLNQLSTSRTFVKRVDLWVLRISPASTDTLRNSLVFGYFHFD